MWQIFSFSTFCLAACFVNAVSKNTLSPERNENQVFLTPDLNGPPPNDEEDMFLRRMYISMKHHLS